MINMVDCDKPVIYVYLPSPAEVEVRLTFTQPSLWSHFVSYPEFTPKAPTAQHSHVSWFVRFGSDSNLSLLSAPSRHYPYLFYEGKTSLSNVISSASSSAAKAEPVLQIPFTELGAALPRLLQAHGLNDTEVNDFVAYWLPRMRRTAMPYVLWRCITQTYSAQVTLELYAAAQSTPLPSTTIRVIGLWCGVSSPPPTTLSLDKYLQALKPAAPRSPLVPAMVEWGAVELQPESQHVFQL
jgi:hypothetical protein